MSGGFSRKTTHIIGILILALCMLINCWHTHLWGPDEPREAEVAREILADSSWIVPHFNGVPYVEKPPLYYDVSALIFSVLPHPGALRLHSAVLGCLMLAFLYFFAVRRCGPVIAFCACALCISMPQFYRAAHWILLDIGVGAWITGGLVCYGLWSSQEGRKQDPRLAALFFLFAGLAFLTKGVFAGVYLGIIILPHWFFCRRRVLPPAWTLLFFLIPAGIWFFLFCREGGVYLLHEHFINNIFGRLLHKDFRLAGSPVTIADVGHNSPLFFYFKRMPNMFGGALALLPFAAAWAWRAQKLPFFSLHLSGKAAMGWDLLTKPHDSSTPQTQELLRYLMLWSFVPLFVLSLPANKEVTYLLPSYAGLALLLVCYTADRLEWEKQREGWAPYRNFLLPLLVFALAAQCLAGYSLILSIGLSAAVFLWLGYAAAVSLYRRQYQAVALPVLAMMIGGVILGNTPEIMVKSRLDRKCYCLFSEKIWRETGNRPLAVKTREESIRGALPFYGRRNIHVLTSRQKLLRLMKKKDGTALLLYEYDFKVLGKRPAFAKCFQDYRIVEPGFREKADTFVLLLPERAGSRDR